MPAFYPGEHGPVQLPHPVAHHGDGYKDAIYEDFSHHGHSYSDYSGAAPPGLAHPSYSGHVDQYGPPAPSAVYNQNTSFPVDDYYPDHHCLHPMGAPMIPPLRIDERVVASQHDYLQASGYAALPEPTYPKEEKATGGVSAKLDYDMDQMTDFVSETTIALYELSVSPICLADIDVFRSIRIGHAVSAAFRKWVLQVLNATRLPSATIILSLSYLAIRVRQENDAGTFRPSERSFYKMITTALILGSKFLDDNTFQNKSWAEVSNIPVKELNEDERNWLMAFGHRLHHDPVRVDGFDAAQQQWKAHQAQLKANQRLSTLQPIDTNLKRQQSMQALSSNGFYTSYHGKTSPSDYSLDSTYSDRAYGTPSYSQYDAWYPYRSMERSPLSSASHSGPQTPEYLGGSNHGWGPFSHYPRDSQHGYPAMAPSYASQVSATPYEYQLPPFRRHCAWSTHGAHCQCQPCRWQNPMHARFGHAIAA